MRSLDIRIIQNWVNQNQIVYLPEFSEVLDISFDDYGNQLNLFYQYDSCSVTNQKIYNIWITDHIVRPPSDFYKFFKTVEKRFSDVNLANANNGIVPTLEKINRYYIFIEEVKTIAESREEKLNEIL